MTEIKNYKIEAFWDEKVGVWVATSEEISGLATEAETLDINKKLREMLPELLILNGMIAEDYKGDIVLELTIHRQEIISLGS